jgi:glycosyltransferase involved in cell wall biosynthesis
MPPIRVLSVVVPVYNSSRTLETLVTGIGEALQGREWELVFVNDGSSDDSWQVIEHLTRGDTRIRGIDLMRNYGQHNALLAGIRAAQNPVIVTLDDDLQHPPAEIPKLLERLEHDDVDVVYGAPITRSFEPWRNSATAITKLALRGAMGSDAADKVSPFRAFRTQVRDAFGAFNGPYVSIDVLLSWGTTRFDSVPVAHHPRSGGRSNYTFWKLASYTLTMLTGFSTRPLRFASLLGLAFTILGFAVFGFVVVRYVISGGPVPGFTFLASAITVFSGAQLLTLGIIGEYLARVHVRVMDHPPFTVRAMIQQTGQ